MGQVTHDLPPPQRAALRKLIVSVFRCVYTDPIFIVCLALSVWLSVLGVMRMAADPQDSSKLTGYLLLCTLGIPSVWAVLNVIWRVEGNLSIIVAIVRSVCIPTVCTIPLAITNVIVFNQASVREALAVNDDPYGWQGFYTEDATTSPMTTVLTIGLGLNMLFASIQALAVTVIVVIPVLSWRKATEAAHSNMLLSNTHEDQRAASSSMRLLSVIIMMVFVVPFIIAYGKNEASATTWVEAFRNTPRVVVDPQMYWPDLLRAFGLLTVPAGVVLVVILKLVQRPDIDRRARWRVNSRSDEDLWEAQQQERAAGDHSAHNPPE